LDISDDPNCACQPKPKKPPEKPPSIKMFLRGSESEQTRELHQPDSELDVFFDLILHTMIIREITKDPKTRKTFRVTYLKIDAQSVHFTNMHGLADNSLLLSFRVRESLCAVKGHKMRMRVKHFGFRPMEDSKLYTDVYCCDWSEQNIEILLPGKRIHEWKTVALILATFHRISKEQWCLLVNMAGAPGIAGLNWKVIESELWPEKSESNEIEPAGAKPVDMVVS
jgi:hypothetical protein